MRAVLSDKADLGYIVKCPWLKYAGYIRLFHGYPGSFRLLLFVFLVMPISTDRGGI